MPAYLLTLLSGRVSSEVFVRGEVIQEGVRAVRRSDWTDLQGDV